MTGRFVKDDLKSLPGHPVTRNLKCFAAQTGRVGKHSSNKSADIFHGGKVNSMMRPDYRRRHVELSNIGFDTRLGVETQNPSVHSQAGA
jgi:hypothetical protein